MIDGVNEGEVTDGSVENFLIPMIDGVYEGEVTGGSVEAGNFEGRPRFFLTPLDAGVTSPKLLTFNFHFSLDGVNAGVFGVNVGLAIL